MQRVAVVANLRPGSTEEAAKLIELGPPFDPDKNGLERHTVYLAADTVVFVFEGGEPRALLASLAGPNGQSVFDAWESLLVSTPKIAKEAYSWVRPGRAERQEDWGE